MGPFPSENVKGILSLGKVGKGELSGKMSRRRGNFLISAVRDLTINDAGIGIFASPVTS